MWWLQGLISNVASKNHSLREANSSWQSRANLQNHVTTTGILREGGREGADAVCHDADDLSEGESRLESDPHAFLSLMPSCYRRLAENAPIGSPGVYAGGRLDL